MPAITGEGDPAGLIAHRDARDEHRWERPVIEDMQALVGCIREPDLLFVRSQADSMAGASVALDRSLAETGYLDPGQDAVAL